MDRLTELERKLENLLRWGSVSAVDAEAVRCRVKMGALETAWLPWFTRRAGSDGDWWAPSVGEQVMVLSPGGDPALGAVLPAVNSSESPAPETNPGIYRTTFADGSSIAYDNTANLLSADLVGDAEITAGGSVRVSAEGDIEAVAVGDVSVQGANIEATASGNITASATHVEAVASGNLTGSAGGQVSLSAPSIGLTGSVTITGPLAVTGTVGITGAVDVTGAVSTTGLLTNNGINVGGLHTHPVPGVGMSGPPA